MKKNISLLWIVLIYSGWSLAQTAVYNPPACSNKNKKLLPSAPTSQTANSRSDTVDILHYTINLNITDFTTNTISGNTQIRFVPKLNGVNYINLDLLELIIDSIQLNNTNLSYSYNDTLLHITLPTALNTNDTANLTVHYHGTPQGDPSGWGGFYFTSGYAYNLGVGFGANPHTYGRVWFPCFDNFVERSTYEFNITTNNGKISFCNGYLAHDTTDNNGNRIRKWIMEQTIPTYLASVAVADYVQVNSTYNSINGNTIPIILAALSGDTTNVKNSFVNLNLALSTYENHFGAYVWNRVGYCMVPFDAGAMEHATNIAYPRLTANGTLSYQTLYAHELSHHWFGDLATCRTQEDMWLNEGWARYCEFLFTEALSGYSAYINEVRANHAENLQFNTPKEGNLTLSNIPFEYTYGDHVYNKGADIAHTLRGYMGDSLFFSSVKTYLSQNHYKDVSSTDFRDALTTASGMNMNHFFNDWVLNPGWPHFSIDSFIVTPNGSNYNIQVFVKQKLFGAPNYYTNVPLEITFKAADWTELTQSFVMSGQTSSFSFTTPFPPVFAAINMGEKISHAVAPFYKTIKTTGTHNFANAKMNLAVSSITDSAFVRIEHNYAAPDSFKSFGYPYRLSPNRYWKVDGILPANFVAKATVYYDGRTTGFSGTQWLDNELITTVEDSLVLLYRQSTADEWHEYPNYTKNNLSNNTDKRGLVTIDSLKLGEYAFAMQDYMMSLQNKQTSKISEIKIYPNPAKDIVTIDISAAGIKSANATLLTITDVSGKIIYKETLQSQQNNITLKTNNYNTGTYFVSITSGSHIAKSKFIIAR